MTDRLIELLAGKRLVSIEWFSVVRSINTFYLPRYEKNFDAPAYITRIGERLVNSFEEARQATTPGPGWRSYGSVSTGAVGADSS